MCTNSKGLVAMIGFSLAFSGWDLNLRHLGHAKFVFVFNVLNHSWPIKLILVQGSCSFNAEMTHIIMVGL